MKRATHYVTHYTVGRNRLTGPCVTGDVIENVPAARTVVRAEKPLVRGDSFTGGSLARLVYRAGVWALPICAVSTMVLRCGAVQWCGMGGCGVADAGVVWWCGVGSARLLDCSSSPF
jgi:hypothetical protein